MKDFLENYGFAIFGAIVVILLIAMSSPVGNLVKDRISNIVESFTYRTETKLASTFNKLGGGISEDMMFGFSVDLEDGLDIYFYMSNLQDKPENYTLEYTFNELTNSVVISDNYLINELSQNELLINNNIATNTRKTFKITVAEVSAKEITDNVFVKLINTKENKVIYENSYSIRGCCEKIIENIDNNYSEKMITLSKAILDYGASAQKYFDYKIDNLANTNYSDISTVYGITIDKNSDSMWYPSSTGSLQDANLTKCSATISFDSHVGVVFSLTPEGNKSIDDYNIVITDAINNKEMLFNKELMSNGRIKITVKGSSANHIGHNVKLNVNNGAYTLCYSPINFAYKHQTDADEKIVTLMKSLY